MNKRNREERELEEWNKMKSMGKKKYIWSKGALEFGLAIGISIPIVNQLLDEGFNLHSLSLSNPNFVRRLIIYIIFFQIGGYIITTSVWRKYKKSMIYNLSVSFTTSHWYNMTVRQEVAN